jgi:hypothetical protein
MLCVCVCVLCMYVVYVVYVVYRGCVFDSSAVQGLSTVQVCVCMYVLCMYVVYVVYRGCVCSIAVQCSDCLPCRYVCVYVLCMYVVYVVYVVYRGCVFDSSAVQGLSTVQVCVYII